MDLYLCGIFSLYLKANFFCGIEVKGLFENDSLQALKLWAPSPLSHTKYPGKYRVKSQSVSSVVSSSNERKLSEIWSFLQYGLKNKNKWEKIIPLEPDLD